MRPPHLLALGLALASAAAPSVAVAHVGHVIARAERYLKLEVAGREARVVVSLTLGADEGGRVLTEADLDGDSEVSVAESEAYLAAWGEGLVTELPVWVDDAPLGLAWGEGYMSPIGQVRRAPVTLEMVARFELIGGEQRVRVEDRMVRREVFDRTDVAFRARDLADLLACGVGEPPEEPVLDLAYGPDYLAGAPVSLHARIHTPPRERGLGDALAWSGLALPALGLVFYLGAWLRKRW